MRDNQYTKRVITLQQEDLPITAEVLIDGECCVANITRILFPTLPAGSNLPNNAQFELQDGLKVDVGQITTFWMTDRSPTLNLSAKAKVSAQYKERTLEAVYRSHVGRGRKGGLSKQQIAQYGEDTQSQAVLRHIVKGGVAQSRVADSLQVEQQSTSLLSQSECARLLAQDAQLGGRFKRWPCVLLACDFTKQKPTLTLMNGGWLVMDQNIRSVTDGQLFAQRKKVQTVTDERIVLRLECLALGEQQQRQQTSNEVLELDVRQVLLEMNLSLDADGAKEALFQLGLWTAKDQDSGKAQFWTPSVLSAAKNYIQSVDQMSSLDSVNDERVDLRHLPCICVDGQRVSFRDDAIGLRSRASTGRRCFPEASKWEILIHIADVSDIYVPKDEATSILREAAASRGISRYDLPTGPVHLLPPVILQALSLRSNKANRSVTIWVYVDERDGRLLDAGVERSLVAAPYEYSFNEASRLMEKETTNNLSHSSNGSRDGKARAILLVTERIVTAWNQARQSRSTAARKREERLTSKETEFHPESMFDDGRDGFVRTRAHRLVDSALDLYSYAAAALLRRVEAPIPRAQGVGADRGGRIATSPLRRFLDGEAQRQLLAVCCEFGDKLSAKECSEAGILSNERRNKVNNVRSVRQKRSLNK
ncbi:hypothetical protein FisN_9Lh034 [Fistulifera solaris]|uniref:RNB domain-containing protein n=1 Tax=Fistulifera solaris TaxID=1519565 RepID=A0A1Z5KKQ0_FISSO|nr:hypothetical protein FisN_9Lh034 [Fistulifera solaris]|eukprot:GAX26767.1 hypothetical protein FisN_9Lh034 [Fistulifera solaris]